MKLLAALAGALAVVAAGAQAAEVDPIFAGFRPDAPGCAVGVAAKGEAPTLRAYGAADLEHGAANTPDTVFEAGSVSKQFTAAAVLLLVQEGKLALTDDIRKYLPEMPDYGRPVTVQHLLSHTSGLRDWGDVAGLGGWPRTSRSYSNDEALAIAARQRALNYAPGAAYSYTNTGYNLAAVIVQRVSGQSLAAFTRDRLFAPLGMSHTSWRDDFRRVVPGRAIAYGRGRDGFSQDMPFENAYGNGGLLTTVGDLLIWNEALSAGKLGPFVTARLQERATITGGRRIVYARGLFVQDWHGLREIAHSGATAGYRAWLARYPDQGVSVAVLCNGANADAIGLGRRVADLYLPPSAAPPPAVLHGPVVEPAYAGLYVDERTGYVSRFAAETGGLRLEGVGALTTLAANRYRIGQEDFVFSPTGVERRTPDGEVINFRRVDPATPRPAEVLPLAGRYASAEAAATLVVTSDGVGLRIAPADRPSNPLIVRPLYRDGFVGNGQLVRVVRDKAGQVTGLRFTGGRVYDLVFHRVGA